MGYLNECFANFCHEDSDDESEDWKPMTLKERIEDAEYALEVHMTTDGKGCVQCILNQPTDDNFIEHLYSVNETIRIDSDGYCHDYSGVAGKRYIALLQKVNMIGQVANKGHLFPDEVNGQIALIEANNEVQSELADMLRNCPAVDYQCPAEDATTQQPVTESGSMKANFTFGLIGF